MFVLVHGAARMRSPNRKEHAFARGRLTSAAPPPCLREQRPALYLVPESHGRALDTKLREGSPLTEAFRVHRKAQPKDWKQSRPAQSAPPVLPTPAKKRQMGFRMVNGHATYSRYLCIPHFLSSIARYERNREQRTKSLPGAHDLVDFDVTLPVLL